MKSSKQSNDPATAGMMSVRLIAVGLIGLGLMSVTGSHAFAQQRIESTLELKMACENNPGNVVTIDQSTKIYIGGGGTVNSGCTVVLANNVTLDFENIGMTFAGPLAVQSAGKAELKFSKSEFRGTSMTFSLAGTGSALTATETNLVAVAGNLNFTLGDDAKMEFAERSFQRPSSDGLSATGRIQISGGRKFIGSMAGKIAHFPVRAPQGISIRMDGGEGLMKIDKVLWYAEQGSVAIAATGPKSLLEMSSASLSIGDAAVIRFEGAESVIKIKQVFVGRAGSGIAAGGITFEAGTGGAGDGKIEVSEFSNGDISSVTMAASRNGQKGSLKVEKSTVGARTGDLLMETGASGSTEVKENRLFSNTRIRIATGAGGSCIAYPNELYAPVVEACP